MVGLIMTFFTRGQMRIKLIKHLTKTNHKVNYNKRWNDKRKINSNEKDTEWFTKYIQNGIRKNMMYNKKKIQPVNYRLLLLAIQKKPKSWIMILTNLKKKMWHECQWDNSSSKSRCIKIWQRKAIYRGRQNDKC